MPVKFGTSGLRGLVSELTDREVVLYTVAFLRTAGGTTAPVAVAGDLRASTPRLMQAVLRGARAADAGAVNCGFVPTPALTAWAMARGAPGIMVTGSHIPADRNGIKFTVPRGEITKPDETLITAAGAALRAADYARDEFDAAGQLHQRLDLPPPDAGAAREYVARYLRFFPPRCLAGTRVVCYEHSAVGRDLLAELLHELGAQVSRVGRATEFVAVDTEAVEDPEPLRRWVQEAGADALVTTDGDGDRPLVTDEQGHLVRGDVLGVIVAAELGAERVVTPVSSNTAVEQCGRFREVVRTRIGSPYVIAGMAAAAARGGRVVGYEANGGFLTAGELRLPDSPAPLPALPTRDAVLPLLTLLYAARRRQQPVSALVRALPPRFTWSALLRDFPSDLGQALVALVQREGAAFVTRHFGEPYGPLAALDFTDGARMTFGSGLIIHLRPSGNAPEFRCYTEADDEATAVRVCAAVLRQVAEHLRPLAAAAAQRGG